MSEVKSVLEDDFDEEPEDVRVSSGDFGDFELVGHGKMTNERCGSFSRYEGCLRTELHNKTIFDKRGNLVDCSGKVFLKAIFYSCDKLSCPICFKRGWATREARAIESRLEENGKYGKGFGRWGLIEHIIVAFPPKFYYLSLEDMRCKTIEALFVRGVIGGSLIFHGGRYNKRKEWYWSPHFHCIGFIRGGYGKCRGCPKCVRGCGGFVDRSYRCHEKDGFIVKVKGKRKTVQGTASYQLDHATVKKNSNRFHVCTWFGVCSYRKMKVEVGEKKVHVCPICLHDLVRVRYVGSDGYMRFNSYAGEFFANFEEDGYMGREAVWLEVGSGSYE